MNQELDQAREQFIQGMSRITHFWGFPKAMGAMYGAIYLSPDPLSLDQMVTQVGVSKGAVSTNVRMLERLGMVHKQLQIGDRKDYYSAETDFWKIVRGVLQEREKNEFNLALRAVSESLVLIEQADAEEKALADFYRQRMQNMQQFFNSLDSLIATLIALDNLRQGSLSKFMSKSGDSKGKSQ